MTSRIERLRSTPDPTKDAGASESLSPAAEPAVDATDVLRSRLDAQGCLRVTCGFELASSATPARYAHRSYDSSLRFAGEAELSQDLQVALAPFLAEVPESAALIAEYLFTSVGEGSVDVRFRLLVESALLPPVQALEQAHAMRDELSVCLRVLADWYAFQGAQFSTSDRTRWSGPRVQLRAQHRLFAASPSGPLGFISDARGARKSTQVLLPQPTGVVTLAGTRPGVRAPLLLRSAGACTLVASIRAARGLVGEMPVRITLRRRNVLQEELEALQSIAGLLSAASHGEEPGESDADPAVTGISGPEAQIAIEQLMDQPECLELAVESTSQGAHSRAWLRILGQELIPGFVSELVQNPIRGQRPRKRQPIDLSQVLAPGSTAPPLLPAPPMLEALSFPRHYPNPTVDFADAGLLLGRAHIGGVVVDVRMPHHDRSLHTYVLGATGTGKSALLYNMAVQDMQAGHGLVVIDPHGDLHDQLLAALPPERRTDLVLIDPDDDRFCPCLNPLDFGGSTDIEAANRVANDMLDIFNRLYDMRVAGGPIFEDYFRHSLLLAVAAPRSGPHDDDDPVPTLATIVHVLRNKAFRQACVARLEAVYGARAAGEIRVFIQQAEATRGDSAFENMAMYVSVKLSRFVTNATMRKLFCSGRRTIDFRRLMDEHRILLVNLSKGDLGGADCRMIGMLLTKYLFNAALSRADVPRAARTPFYCYLDEFQNFVATDIPDMLAEARKYGLHLVLANQTLGQLTEDGHKTTLAAVLGNVATRLFFRVGQQEAEIVDDGFAPHFDDQTLTNLPDRHVLCRLQVKGKPSLPFVFQTLAPVALPAAGSAERSMTWAATNQLNARPLAAG